LADRLKGVESEKRAADFVVVEWSWVELNEKKSIERSVTISLSDSIIHVVNGTVGPQRPLLYIRSEKLGIMNVDVNVIRHWITLANFTKRKEQAVI